MAADSFPFLWEAICRDLRPYRDGLITLGALYGIKLTWTGIRALTKTLYVYGASRIWPWTREDWSHRYGTWAVINRLESSALSLALAKQLAQRGIGIIIIDFFESEEDTDAILKQIGTDHNVTTYGVVHYDDEKFLDQIKRLAELFRIGMLVNCFEGTGLVGLQLHDDNVDREDLFADERMSALTRTIATFLPVLEAAEIGGGVINVTPLSISRTPSWDRQCFASYLAKFLENECRHRQLTSLNLTPFINCGFLTPTCETYASHGIRCLGFTNSTYGHWAYVCQGMLQSLLHPFLLCKLLL